ncbi:hypothetical protein Mgra_00001046, partial [Meloidogyne graminicola]
NVILNNTKTTLSIYRLLLEFICFDYSIYYGHFIFIIKNNYLIEVICQKINYLEALALEKCNWIYDNNFIEEEIIVESFNNLKNINNWTNKNENNKKDFNNNNIILNNLNNSFDSINVENKILDTTLDELPSLSILPELNDKDLDEFFKLVEQ